MGPEDGIHRGKWERRRRVNYTSPKGPAQVLNTMQLEDFSTGNNVSYSYKIEEELVARRGEKG